jgi:pimeloyl-ACP methyl ester carboxylesterase
LEIDKADILGWSMGSLIAQEFTLMNPDLVDRLILYGSNCGGEGAIPPSPEVMQAFAGYANSSYPIPNEKEIESLYYPADWLKANPNHQGLMPAPKEVIAPEVLQAQFKAAANWNGTCSDLQISLTLL